MDVGNSNGLGNRRHSDNGQPRCDRQNPEPADRARKGMDLRSGGGGIERMREKTAVGQRPQRDHGQRASGPGSQEGSVGRSKGRKEKYSHGSDTSSG